MHSGTVFNDTIAYYFFPKTTGFTRCTEWKEFIKQATIQDVDLCLLFNTWIIFTADHSKPGLNEEWLISSWVFIWQCHYSMRSSQNLYSHLPCGVKGCCYPILYMGNWGTERSSTKLPNAHMQGVWTGPGLQAAPQPQEVSNQNLSRQPGFWHSLTSESSV